MDSGHHIFNNPGEFGSAFLGAGNALIIGITMVTDRIKNDINWRMWTAIAAVIVPALAFVSWSHANMVEHIDLKLGPIVVLVDENTHARKMGGRYTEAMAHEDKEEHRVEHAIERANRTRMQQQIDALSEMIVGEDRFSQEGAKMDQRIIRLEERVFK